MRRLGRSISAQILKLKSQLPLNGDWLFVTETPTVEEQIDTADKYREPSAVLKEISERADAATAKVIYERAKSYETFVGEIANRVYDKAKAIFGASSFASTILLALGSTLLPPLLASTLGLAALGVLLSCLLVVHLGRSVMIAAEVMTRETVIRETPDELLALSQHKEDDALKQLIATTLAYSIQTHTFGRAKLNRLIIAQHSFRYALAYYFGLAALSIAVRIL